MGTWGKQASLDPEGLRTGLQSSSCACAGHSWVGVLHLLHPLFGLFDENRMCHPLRGMEAAHRPSGSTGCPTASFSSRARGRGAAQSVQHCLSLQEHDIETPYGLLHVVIRGSPKGNRPAILTYHDVGLNRKCPQPHLAFSHLESARAVRPTPHPPHTGPQRFPATLGSVPFVIWTLVSPLDHEAHHPCLAPSTPRLRATGLPTPLLSHS